MSKVKFFVLLLIAVVIAWWWQSSEENARAAEQMRQERLAFEKSRVSTNDPLLNLAGCMANHSTQISQMVVAQAIFSKDRRIRMEKEEVDNYNDTRNALFEKCSPEYYSKVIEEYRSITVANLNFSFFQVMRNDPEVAKYMSFFSESHEAKKEMLVK